MDGPLRTDLLIEQARSSLEKAGVDTPKLDAEILLARAMGVSRASLHTWPEREVPAESRARFDEWVLRRGRLEPVAYLLGDQEFYGHLFVVTCDVLIPRPETEHIIEVVLGLDAAKAQEPVRILDVGTGSGCIACTLALELPRAEVLAVDISEQALLVAEKNIREHGLGGRVLCRQSDLLASLEVEEAFDVIVSNPPYVESTHLEVMQPDVAHYEPHLALFAGETGLDIIRRLSRDAFELLLPGGALVLEFGAGQHEAIEELLVADGYNAVTWTKDLSGHIRVVSALKPV